MALYSIKEETLTDIGDALRRKHGETKWIVSDEGTVLVSKSQGSTGFNNYGGQFNTGEILEVIKITGANSIKITLQSSFYTGYMQLFIAPGKHDTVSMNKDYYKYNNKNGDFVFEDIDTITIKYVDAYAQTGNYGYYMEIRGFDADGNALKKISNTYKSSEMAQAIDDIETSNILPEEAFVISGNCEYKFSGTGWNWFIEKYGNQITTNNISDASNMFYNNRGIKEIPFDLNFRYGGCDVSNMFFQTQLEKIPTIDFNQSSSPNSNAMNCNNLFKNSYNITSIGTIKNLYPNNMSGFFSSCYRLRNIPEFENLKLDFIYSNTYHDLTQFFENCYSLRTIPEDFIKQLYQPYCTGYYYSLFYSGFASCYVLDEIKGLNPQTGQMTSSNLTSTTFHYCYRLKNLIFATQDDGTPYAVKWKSQVISLDGDGYAPSPTFILNYNSGITADKEVKDDATYQALKNDPDWFTTKIAYSRYNHDSAVATINSLPDTSAYLATAGGTNTIKFKGQAGASTDGGAINTLTEEEIAVAAAKGWTVTLV